MPRAIKSLQFIVAGQLILPLLLVSSSIVLQDQTSSAESLASTNQVPVVSRLVGRQARFECRLWGVSGAPEPNGQVIDEAPAGAGAEEATSGGATYSASKLEEEEEAVELILWYHLADNSQLDSSSARNSSSLRPIYIVDARRPLTLTAPPSAATSSSLDGELTQVSWRQQAPEGLNYAARLTSQLGRAKHYALRAASKRLSLLMSGQSAYLIIDQVRRQDAGQYKCRVDFRYARTLTQTSQLQVIVPVTQLELETASDKRNSVGQIELPLPLPLSLEEEDEEESLSGRRHQVTLMEADEEELLRFECRAKDGWPPPRLAWWRLEGAHLERLSSAAAISTSVGRDFGRSRNTSGLHLINTRTTDEKQPQTGAETNNGGHVEARPRWLRMLLVGRRSINGSTQAGEGNMKSIAQIELTPLRNGQSLHLNLAAESGGVELHFVCQVGGAWPAARVEWRLAETSGSGEQELVSDSAQETNGLMRQLALEKENKDEDHNENNARPRPRGCYRGPSNSTNKWQDSPLLGEPTYEEDNGGIQWSSLRLHNVGLREHSSAIKCLAETLDELDYANSGERPKVTTSISLNITHVPMVELELLHAGSPIHGGQLQVDERLGEEEHVSLIGQSDKLFEFESKREKQQQQQQTVVLDQNVTLVCRLRFANPELVGPIEWSINDNELAMANGAVKVVDKLKESTTADSERLIVQFVGSKSQSQVNQQPAAVVVVAKCLARNALGSGQSNELRLVIGPKPHCDSGGPLSLSPTQTELASDKLEQDKNQSLHCAVISDRNSSTYSWLWLFAGNQSSVIAATSREPAIQVSRFNSPQFVSNAKVSAKELRNQVRCFASDKFASNEADPCQIRVILAKESNRQDNNAYHTSGAKGQQLLAHNCRAKLVQKTSLLLHNREPLTTPNASNVIANGRPRLLAKLECDNNGFGLPRSLHFDLYRRLGGRKEQRQFVRHLISRDTNANTNSNTNLSFMVDLEQENGSLADHFIVLSGGSGDANVTLQFEPPSDPLQEDVGGDDFGLLPVAEETQSAKEPGGAGHRDRLWVIGCIVVVFLSSSLLVIVAWLCKAKGQATGGGAAAQRVGKLELDRASLPTAGAESNCCSSGSQGSAASSSGSQCGAAGLGGSWQRQASEMYLVGRDVPLPPPHPAAYHKPPEELQELMGPLGLMKEEKPTQEQPDSYDFLIIDPPTIKSKLAADQAGTLLLIEQSSASASVSATPGRSDTAATCTGNSHDHHHQHLHQQAWHSHCSCLWPRPPPLTSGHQADNGDANDHIGPMSVQVPLIHLDSGHGRDHEIGGDWYALSRADLRSCSRDLLAEINHQDESNQRSYDADLELYSPSAMLNGANASSPLSRSCRRQMRLVDSNRSEPIDLAPALNLQLQPALELNSQGELTMTDESSAALALDQVHVQAQVCLECRHLAAISSCTKTLDESNKRRSYRAPSALVKGYANDGQQLPDSSSQSSQSTLSIAMVAIRGQAASSRQVAESSDLTRKPNAITRPDSNLDLNQNKNPNPKQTRRSCERVRFVD